MTRRSSAPLLAREMRGWAVASRSRRPSGRRPHRKTAKPPPVARFSTTESGGMRHRHSNWRHLVLFPNTHPPVRPSQHGAAHSGPIAARLRRRRLRRRRRRQRRRRPHSRPPRRDTRDPPIECVTCIAPNSVFVVVGLGNRAPRGKNDAAVFSCSFFPLSHFWRCPYPRRHSHVQVVSKQSAMRKKMHKAKGRNMKFKRAPPKKIQVLVFLFFFFARPSSSDARAAPARAAAQRTSSQFTSACCD